MQTGPVRWKDEMEGMQWWKRGEKSGRGWKGRRGILPTRISREASMKVGEGREASLSGAPAQRAMGYRSEAGDCGEIFAVEIDFRG